MSVKNVKDALISNIINTNAGRTNYGKHQYSDLWYVCDKNKICVTFTPIKTKKYANLFCVDVIKCLFSK
jgi:hypothetical protein